MDGDCHGARAGRCAGPDTTRWSREATDDGTSAPAPGGDDLRRLLADVGHELKSPLSIVLALCARLEDGGRLADDDAEDVARIRANAYTMLRRVQDLALLARLDSGGLPLEAAVVDVAAIVGGCLDGFASVADERGVRLRRDLPGELCAVADDEKLLSAVSNLIANGIRHAPPGGVVRCSLRTGADEVVVEVADDGPGVPADQRERVFERYRRERSSTGSGLGLSIVRDVARLHGGRVTAGDAPEGGALFTLTLPRRPQRATTVRPVRSLGIADRQRALVEDLRAELARP